MKKIYKYINYILAPLMLFIIFAACGGDEPEYNESMSSPRMMGSSESASFMPKEVSGSPGSQGSDQLTNISERKISKNAQLEIKVKSLDDSMNFITQKQILIVVILLIHLLILQIVIMKLKQQICQ